MACRTLLAIGDAELPVDVVKILERCKNTRLMTYTEAGQRSGRSVYGMVGALPSARACTIRYEYGEKKLHLVLYNDDVCFGNWGSRRWSLAHELGHIVMGHREDGAAEEREANCYAQHLLCPRPLIEVMPKADDYLMKVAFGLSMAAARIALEGVGKRCEWVDEEMREKVRALYGVGEGSKWEDVLHPIQKALVHGHARKGGPAPDSRERQGSGESYLHSR